MKVVITKSETVNIPQPEKNALLFKKGYIKIHNTGKAALHILKSDSHLKNLAEKNDKNLMSSKIGFYELAPGDTGTVSGLKCINTANGTDIPIPDFELKTGMLYSFECNGSTITGSAPQSITY